MNGVVEAFQLWDRIWRRSALGSPGISRAGRSRGRQSGVDADSGRTAVLPRVREAILSRNLEVRQRTIRIVAWQGDLGAMQTLRQMQERDSGDSELLGWAIQKMQILHPKLSSRESSAGQ